MNLNTHFTFHYRLYCTCKQVGLVDHVDNNDMICFFSTDFSRIESHQTEIMYTHYCVCVHDFIVITITITIIGNQKCQRSYV